MLTSQNPQNRTERQVSHTLKPGDILHHSWGWEQINCDFYQVLAVGEHTATIRELAGSTVPESTYPHGMAEMRTAVRDVFVQDSKPIRVHVSGLNRVTASRGAFRHGSCGPWDGTPKYCSWYE